MGVGAWVAVVVVAPGALEIDEGGGAEALDEVAAGEDAVAAVDALCVPEPDVELVHPASADTAARASTVSIDLRRITGFTPLSGRDDLRTSSCRRPDVTAKYRHPTHAHAGDQPNPRRRHADCE
jgi:hypothetical protein